MEAAVLLLLAFCRDAEAFIDHLPPRDVAAAYSEMCWTWDSGGWFWWHAWEARRRGDRSLPERLISAEQARRCVTSRQWVTQEWPVPAWWRSER